MNLLLIHQVSGYPNPGLADLHISDTINFMQDPKKPDVKGATQFYCMWLLGTRHTLQVPTTS